MRAVFFLMFGGLIVALAPAPLHGADGDAPVAVTWQLVGNRADNTYQAVLTLRNVSAQPLPERWTLYFNTSSRLQPESLDDAYALEHVNGDVYALRPAAETEALAAGAQQSVAYTGGPWAINVSDAPSGFYFVAEDAKGNELPPATVSVDVAPFPDAKHLVRGAADEVPIATPSTRFAENAGLTLLPLQELTRVLPTPVRVTSLPGRFQINPQTVIISDPTLAGEAQQLAEALRKLLGTTLRLEESGHASSNAIRLRIAEVEVNGTAHKPGDQAYQLTVDSKSGIEIVGSDAAGVFDGIQSLRALVPIAAYREPLPELAIDAVRIEDAPRFAYRGLHLDVARNFQSKESVKKLLDLMALYKLNRFHWHLTDDEGWRIEIEGIPELTAVGSRRGHTRDDSTRLIPSFGSGPHEDAANSTGSGYYSQDDVIEILRYAADRHIEVIPEIDLPGHSRAAIKATATRAQRLQLSGDATAADEFRLTDPADASQYESIQMWRDNVVDVGLESTYRFLDVVIGELAAMYERAGLKLATVHLGGDEVPHGAWDNSPACASIAIDDEGGFTRNQQLQLHFLERACDILAKYGIRPACWEDCLLFKNADGRIAADSPRARELRPIVYVWNNVWGWGNEDAAYRLANAGYDVVLCNATHLYLDLACEKDPEEIGYYWAGFVGDRQPFEFNPLDVFQNATVDGMGRPLADDQFAGSVRLTDNGRRHILGIQGQLWGENLRSREQLEYMAFPRVIAVAERAWTQEPTWVHSSDREIRAEQIQSAWNHFANCLGQRDLPRLDYLGGGVEYRLPPPGATVRDGKVFANSAFPGLTIRYTTDGREPTAASPVFADELPLDSPIQLRVFDTRGRGSRATIIAP